MRGLSADMEDLLSAEGRRQARDFFDQLMFTCGHGLFVTPSPAAPGTPRSDYRACLADTPKSGEKDVVIVTDSTPGDEGLAAMIADFRAALPYKSRVVDLREFPFAGGCLGCMNCAVTGKCVYKDGFDDFLRGTIQTADAFVYAFAVCGHSAGARFKCFDDRQFCNGHRTVTRGTPVAYLIRGDYRCEPNLRMVVEARAEVGGNYLAGVATDEGDTAADVAALAENLAFALDKKLTRPANFYGVGGMKIFRDLIYVMQGFMKAEKAHFADEAGGGAAGGAGGAEEGKGKDDRGDGGPLPQGGGGRPDGTSKGGEMIFYFSGTGNSRWAASQIAALTGDEAVGIVGMERAPDLAGEKQVGLVFPIYAWGPAAPMLKFAGTLRPAAGAFTFVVCTCGEEAGKAMKGLERAFPLDSAYSLVMPNNYMVGSADVDDEATARAKVEAARGQIARLAEEVKERKTVYRVKEGGMAALKSGMVNWGFNHFARTARPFFATDACTGCGLCAKDCPAGVITMKEGRPVWGEGCWQCLRCINACPTRAIQYGKDTANKGRYTLDALLKEEK